MRYFDSSRCFVGPGGATKQCVQRRRRDRRHGAPVWPQWHLPPSSMPHYPYVHYCSECYTSLFFNFVVKWYINILFGYLGVVGSIPTYGSRRDASHRRAPPWPRTRRRCTRRPRRPRPTAQADADGTCARTLWSRRSPRGVLWSSRYCPCPILHCCSVVFCRFLV